MQIPMVGFPMLAQWSPVGQIGDVAVRSQYSRQVPSPLALATTQPEPGAQSAVGLQAASAGVLPAGEQPSWAGLVNMITVQAKPD